MVRNMLTQDYPCHELKEEGCFHQFFTMYLSGTLLSVLSPVCYATDYKGSIPLQAPVKKKPQTIDKYKLCATLYPAVFLPV